MIANDNGITDVQYCDILFARKAIESLSNLQVINWKYL